MEYSNILLMGVVFEFSQVRNSSELHHVKQYISFLDEDEQMMTVVFSVRSRWSFGISNSTSDRLLKVQSAFSNQVSVEWNIYTLFQYVT